MTKIFTPLSLLGTIIVVVLFNHLTGYSIQGFSFFFIIPLGALLVGAAASCGLFFGLLKDNKPVTKEHYIAGAVIGLVAFFGIYYVDYKTTYLDANNNVNYSFQGDPISSYELDGEPITFGKFLSLTTSGKQQFYFHGRPVGGEVDTGKGFGSFMQIIEILAAMIAGAGVGLTIVGDKTYCDNCKKYMKDRTMLKFSIDKYEEVADEINSSKNDPVKLKQLFAKYELKKDEKVTAFGQVDLLNCPNCHNARLIVKIYRLGSNSNFEEVNQHRQNLRIDEDVSRGLNS